jgi:aspartyl-tRNA(Asn)/glutamyl-tRNA(Gln) amidotransferase subunit A
VDDLVRLGALDLRDRFSRRELSPVEALDAFAARIEEVEPQLKAFVTLALDEARDDARRSEGAYLAGSAGPLEGIPLAVKDLYDTAGIRTTYGSRMFDEHVPAADAEAVRLARAAGAVVVGKTSVHEFAWGVTNYNAAFDAGRNPWALDRISGGSSGGSAAALATFEAPLALGSDTGGSIRIPASFCGIAGFKPTFGRVSTAGAWPLAPSLDHAGPMARSPADAALLFAALTGVEAPRLRTDVTGLRVASCADLLRVEPEPPVRAAYDAALEALREAGATLVEAAFPEADDLLPTFRPIQAAEAVAGHRRLGLWPERREEYGPDVRERLEGAEAVTFDDYRNAIAARERHRETFARIFDEADILVTPVSAVLPVERGSDETPYRGGTAMLRDVVLPYSTPQDLAGLPSCAVRAGFDERGLPIGVQLAGRYSDDWKVLGAAQALWEATPDVQSRWPDLPSQTPS